MHLPTKPLRAALLGALLLAACPCAAFAEDGDRTAGKIHVAPRARTAEPAPPEPRIMEEEPEYRPAPERPPASDDVNFAALESLGLLTQASQGGLGRDVWHGTNRSTVREFLPALPAQAQYRTMQLLARRLLLTKADSTMLQRDERPEPGSDLTTLRIEKLLETGAYKEAFSLYTMVNGTPYHESLAQLGVLAALYNRESALACLEAESIGIRFADVSFWQQLSKICRYVLSKAGSDPVRDIDFPDSRILEEVVRKDTFRFKPATLDDMQQLQPLEAAILAAEKRFDFSSLSIGRDEYLPPHVLTVMLEDPSLPEEQAFRLYVKALERGLKTPGDLATYYETKATEFFGKDKSKTSLTGYASVSGWRRLPYLYRAATNAPGEAERRTVIREALELAPEYGTAALWPFADIIAGISPDNYAASLIRDGLTVLAETGTVAGPGWVDAVHSTAADEAPAALLIVSAEGLSPAEVENNDAQEPENQDSLETAQNHAGQLLAIAYEKLDKAGKLHNYSASVAYEKLPGLTSPVDYVMPLDGLLENLDRAESEQRLGEIILLSSIALRDAPPAQLSPEVFREVLDGLLTVGLTKEAQMLANEVILGLSVK